MRKHLLPSLVYTLITSVLLGIAYPLAITAIAQIAFHVKANGQLLYNQKGELIGSALIGQPFVGDTYFHSRPSVAGTGYDASASSGSNLGPTSKALKERIAQSVNAENATSVPVDLVTTSASGLDQDITPAAALFQIPRVARARGISEAELHTLVERHITSRQLGILGEPRVNVLLLNQALDKQSNH